MSNFELFCCKKKSFLQSSLKDFDLGQTGFSHRLTLNWTFGN